ncbi:Neprilysin-1 [Trichostrongylus colubriformis]|uniref:Neprilysin-1 n=1 Tax=Trichostrongylus colubriformis TaxID=6319 RepID=A0AAN8FY01_TRICO
MDVSTILLLLYSITAQCHCKKISLSNFLKNITVRADNLTLYMHDVDIHNGLVSFDSVRVEADGVQYNPDKRSEHPYNSGAERVVHYPELASSIDRSIDPCRDFYSYVCKGWIKSHPIPENQFELTQTQVLKEKILREMKELMVTIPAHTTREDILMRIFYQKCVHNTLQPDNDGISMLLSKMRILRRTTSLTDWLLAMRTETIFYDLTVSVDEYNSSANILQIVPGTSMMSARIYFDPAYSHEFVATRDVLFKMLALLSSKDIFMEFFPPNLYDHVRRIESLIMVDQTVAKILEETEFNTDSITVTVAELRGMLKTVDWIRYAHALLPPQLRYSLARRPVRITKTATIQRLEEILLSIDDQTLSDYLDWKAIFHYGDFLGEDFQRLMEEFTAQVYGVKGIDRINDCVSLAMNTFYDIAGRLYLERYFNFDSVFIVKELVEDVRAAFLEMLNKNEWMDMETKERARRKANAIRDFIGYDNNIFNDTLRQVRYAHLTYTATNSYYDITMAIQEWMRESVFLKLDKTNTRGTFDTSVMEVNAFYDSNRNQVAVSAGILQSPFFNASLPRLLNYGAIGVVAGHEVTHAFDDSGASYDEFGNKNDWWDEATYKNFERRKECFDHQYGSIFVNDLNVQIDGRRTEGENIADNGGMRAAIRAASRLSERTSEHFTIAGLEGYTQMQYFFMNYAFIWCGNTRRATLLNKLANDVHAPDMYRVNVVLSNQPEFAEAFECQRGSPMFPERTCTLW